MSSDEMNKGIAQDAQPLSAEGQARYSYEETQPADLPVEAAYPAVESESSNEPQSEKAAKRKKRKVKKIARRRKRKIRRAKKQERKKMRKVRALAGTKEFHQINEDAEVIIRFDHVTKTYDLYKDDKSRFLGIFNIQGKGYLGTVKANNDISFEIRRGEAVAFLGLNGAGKSTALKMITGVTHPTEGTVEVNGRVSALLELSAGFDKKLTGRENLRLRGQVMGLDDDDLDEIIPKAIEFADLGMYIDQPMRSYSSGMRARLGFALAVSVSPEVLVIDEALAVGDRQFKKRCIERITEIMMNEDVTVLFVTHSANTAQQFCSRGIVLDHGQKLFDGTIEGAMQYYEEKV